MNVLSTTWTFCRCPLTKANGLLKTVRLPVLFGSLVIFPSKDGQITSSRALFVRKEFIQRLRANRQDSYLSLEFMQQSVLCAHRCNVSAFRDGFCDNLSDYIIFRRRSTGRDFSVPQYIHSFGAALVLTSTRAGRQGLVTSHRQLQSGAKFGQLSHFTGLEF